MRPECCPACGSEREPTTVGPFTRERATKRLSGGGRTETWDRWDRYRCADCDQEFALLDKRVRFQVDADGEQIAETRELVADGGLNVSYRRDEAEGGEGWPRARDDHFTLHASEGPWRVLMEGVEVDDVAMWSASGTPVADVVVSLAAEREEGNHGAAALAYFDADAARALAAQILTAADAADSGHSFDPCTETSDWRHLNVDSDQGAIAMGGRYRVECSVCGVIEADTDDSLYSRPTAERRAGWHESTGSTDPHANHFVSVIEDTDDNPEIRADGGQRVEDNLKHRKGEMTACCPECGNAKIHERKTMEPRWRCPSGHEFDEPLVRPVNANRRMNNPGDGIVTDGGHLPSDPRPEDSPDPEDDPFVCSICGAPLGELKRVRGEEHCDMCQREYGPEPVPDGGTVQTADDPHVEPLRVTEADGLCLPEDYIGHEGGLVARMPNGGTIDFKPREWGGTVGNVVPRHFGEVNDDGPNAHLEADQVGLKKYGQEPEVFAVEVRE